MTRRVCIVTNKDLTRNTRVERQLSVLCQHGIDVTVVCRAPPQFKSANIKYLLISRDASSVFSGLRGLVYQAVRKLKLRKNKFPQKSADVKSGANRNIVPVISYWVESKLFSSAVNKRLKSTVFDLIQAHDHIALEACGRLARRLKATLIYDAVEVPFMLTEVAENSFFRGLVNHIRARESKILINNASIITVSDSLGKFIYECYGRLKPITIMNCARYVSANNLGNIKEKLNIENSSKVLVYINSIAPNRGLEDIVIALGRLPKQFRLVVMGPAIDSLYFKELLDLVHECNVSDRVHFPPLVSSSAVSMTIAGADVGLVLNMPASFNLNFSLPNRFFELLMARVPMIVSGIPELASKVSKYDLGEQWSIDQGTKGLIEKIEKLCDSTRNAQVKANIEESLAQLNWKEEGMKYWNVIESTIQ